MRIKIPAKLNNALNMYSPDVDFRLIEKAYQYAEKHHAGQRRKAGEPYIIHPVEVAVILAEYGMDTKTIAAGLLHDVIEDTSSSKAELAEVFGVDIAELVDGVSHLTGFDFSKLPSEEIQEAKYKAMIESLRKFFLAMAKDIRVVLIKLADRLHNMRTLDAMSPADRKRKSRETLEIFAPLADRMGMGKMKAELEDLAFRYTDPAGFRKISELVEKGATDRRHNLSKIRKLIAENLKRLGINAEMDGRVKHLYSAYRKLQKVDGDISKIYDLLAIRVVVDTVEECYQVLGVIHQHYKPLIYRIKDYISVPKPNGYQSLHTTVIGPGGVVTEFQIRTREMHEEAEMGVAAHWHYDETKKSHAYQRKASFAGQDKLEWINQLMDWQNQISDNAELAESLSIDFFNDRIFVMSPKGDVYNLPKQSTPVDFAYEIHSHIGDKCRGAKINGKMGPLSTELHNRDIVEIVVAAKNDKSGPSRDWLDFVRTTKAKQHIRSWYRKLSRDQHIREGKELLAKELALYGVHETEIDEGQQKEVIGTSGWKSWDDVLAAIGDGTVTVRQVAKRLIGEHLYHQYHEKQKDKDVLPTETVVREKEASFEGMLIRYAECCNPKKGDEVVGFITRGRGITVHRRDCKNLLTTPDERLIQMNMEVTNILSVPVEVIAENRVGLLRDITQVLAQLDINIDEHKQTKNEHGESVISMKLATDSPDRVMTAVGKLTKLAGVLSVKQK